MDSKLQNNFQSILKYFEVVYKNIFNPFLKTPDNRVKTRFKNKKHKIKEYLNERALNKIVSETEKNNNENRFKRKNMNQTPHWLKMPSHLHGSKRPSVADS